MQRFYIILLLAMAFGTMASQARQKPAYVIWNGDGQQLDYHTMLAHALDHDIVLFGELHNNPIAHWLQFEITRDIYQTRGDQLTLGAEMFEADNQLVLDEYLNDIITERNFTAEARLWNNYQTDYKPLVEFAREHGLSFVATNIPRRYASLVHRQGFEALEGLSEQALSYIAPLPVLYDPDLPGYKAMLEMSGMPAHANVNFPKAQAIKDATMAHFVTRNMEGMGIFLHFHGAYHSNNYEGIYWYLKQHNSQLRIMTISTVEQDDPAVFNDEHLNLADFIIVVPSTMTKTY